MLLVWTKIFANRKVYKTPTTEKTVRGDSKLLRFLSNKKSDIYKKFFNMRAAIKGAFGTIKEELDDHREAINENSNEISANYEYLVKIENKVDKLCERLDNMHLWMEELSGRKISEPTIELTKTEQKIFLMLYTASDSVSCNYLAESLGIRAELVSNAIDNLSEKGIPVIHGRGNLMKLDKGFREIHAKRNLVKIDGSIILDGLDLVKNIPVACD